MLLSIIENRCCINSTYASGKIRTLPARSLYAGLYCTLSWGQKTDMKEATYAVLLLPRMKIELTCPACVDAWCCWYATKYQKQLTTSYVRHQLKVKDVQHPRPFF